MNERLRPIHQAEGYDVSDLGRVRNDRTGRILKPLPNLRSRYVMVLLYTKTGPIRRYIHLLVLEAFRGPRPSKRHEGAHWDNDRANAKLSNLRWATKEEQWDDRRRHGSDNRGEKNGRYIDGRKMRKEAVSQ